jgi:dUTP pyrophosphatase
MPCKAERKRKMELTQEYLRYHIKVNGRLDNNRTLMFKLINTEDIDYEPTKKYPSDAGYDCRARLDKTVVIEPGKRACVPLGFGINIPLNHTGDLRPRSGMTRDNGIMVGYGTIDAGYTGELMATIFNFGEEPFEIHPKDRIAQLVVLPIVQSKYMESINLERVADLVELERGNKGHGSSGVK